MKWKYFQLDADNPKAKLQVLKNLQMGSQEHTLSKKLLRRFSEASGTMLLIAFESLDLDADCLYEHATYRNGQIKPSDSKAISWTDCPRWGLVSLIDKYLHQSKDAVVLCENIFSTQKIAAESPNESRMLFFQDEVYHVLTDENAGRPESIECVIRESEDHWATGVCSSCTEVPQDDIPSETFFDTIVANTTHIFTPALDGEGYLVWRPCSSPQDGMS